MFRSSLLLALALSFNISFANYDLIGRLHEASENLDQSIDRASLVDSLYSQMRLKIAVTDKSLAVKDVDEKTRAYIESDYLPGLLKSYEAVYAELKSAKEEFSDCEAPTVIKEEQDVLSVLCVRYAGGLQVVYMSNGYNQGWETNASFFFEDRYGLMWLTKIDLHLEPEQKVSVVGV